MQYKYLVITSVVLGVMVGGFSFLFLHDQDKSTHTSVTQSLSKADAPGTGQINQNANNEHPPLSSSSVDVLSVRKMGSSVLSLATSTKASWATRTLPFQGKMVTYELGKGNPSEVALTGAELEEYRHQSNRGYMIPEAELAMSEFLSSEGFDILTTQCRKRIEWYNSPENPQYQFPLNLTMESMMYIDPKTGRKEFDTEKYQGISTFWYTLDNPLEDNDKQMWHECMDPENHRIVKEAMSRFFDAGRSYNNPL